MTELKLDGLFDKQGGDNDPYRGTLAGLFAQRRVLLREIKDKLFELTALNQQIEQRAQMVIVGYTGVGRLGRWLMRRAWKRVLRHHDVSLRDLIADGKHCADSWECCHREGLLCDDACAEQHNLRRLMEREKAQKALEPANLAAALDELWAEGQAPPRDMTFVKSRD